MTTEIRVPALGESVSEATIAKWMKAVGDAVAVDEPLVELETDKVTAEIAAEAGSDVAVGALLGSIAEGQAAARPKPASGAQPAPGETAPMRPAAPAPQPRPASAPPSGPTTNVVTMLSPAVRKLVEEHHLDPASIPASGKDGRLTKGDVLEFVANQGSGPALGGVRSAVSYEAVPPSPPPRPEPAAAAPSPAPPHAPVAREERVRMTRLRKMVAARLKEAQNTAAMLTTFNEVDMTAANALRSRYRDSFEKKHGVRLGVMSLFVKACVVALKEFPAVNAEIDGDDLVYKNHYDIAIAVSSPQGLVVPVVRDCDALGFAEVEAKIADFGKRARDGQLAIEEMQGGTFTITNGGVFGSLMSTPILNPPQSAILGMHKIQPRPMALPDGRIEARPMMYVALSYDHRIIDGREAVSFLVRVKECVEDPQRILLGA